MAKKSSTSPKTDRLGGSSEEGRKRGGGRTPYPGRAQGGVGATILTCLKVRHRPEDTTLLYEAPKTELGQVVGGPRVLGLQEHLPHH